MIQIQSVRLINILNHTDTTIEFGPLTVIKGWNGEGKSAIADGIEFCLTAKARGMKLKKDFANILKVGASKGSVTIEVMNNNIHTVITRTLTPSACDVTFSEDGGGTIVGAPAQKLIYRIMGIDETMATVYFDAFALPRLPSKERKKLLQQLVMTGGPEVLTKYLKEKGHEIPPHIMEQINDAFLKDGLGSDSKGAHGVAVTRRRALKRELEEINNETPPEIDSSLRESNLPELEASLSRLLTEKAELDNDYDPIAGERQTVESQIREIKLTIEECEEALGKFVDPDPRAELQRAEQIFDDATRALELIANPSYSSVARELEAARDTLIAHVPNGSKKTMDEIKLALKAEAQATLDNQAHQDSQRKAQEAKEAARLKVADWSTMARDCESKQSSLTAAKTALENAKVKLKELPKPVVRDESERANEKGMVQKRIDDMSQSIAQVNQHKIYLQNQESLGDKRKLKTQGITRWDAIATDLNPKADGLSQLLGGNFGALQEQIEKVSTALGIPATLRPDFEIEARETSVEYCSVSEQYRIGIAILFALASLLAVGFVSLDSGDILQGEARNALKRALGAISKGGMQIVLYTTGKPMGPETKSNIRIYSIHGGTIYTQAQYEADEAARKKELEERESRRIVAQEGSL